MATILIIDDDAAFLHSMKKTAETLGHVALTAINTAEAARLLHHKPDIALIDLVMPKVDGLEAMNVLRVALPGMRIVAVTGARYSDFDPLAVALELGADGALKKPITAEMLSSEIARLEARSR